MSQGNKQIKSLNIKELISQDRYIIPIYQRNYAWGNDEIEVLLTDMVKAFERNVENYYIGSLVVYLRPDGQFEVIDGQQRLTTFTLIKAFLQREKLFSDGIRANNLSFEYRTDSDKALNNLQDIDDLPSNFKDTMQSIERHWSSLVKYDVQKIADFILEKVIIIRTEVPPETDLNHYFEIMNTRGEQLEKHEILKARFMSRLQELGRDHTHIQSIQVAFANIWDACSDMNRYVVMVFSSEIRKQIFGKNWQKMPSENFLEIADYFIEQNKDENSNETKPTMSNLLDKTFAFQNISANKAESSDRFNSVIDFPNFLLHVLRVFDEKSAKSINLDEKNLLDSFKVDDFDFEKIQQFACLLLKCRYLFDRYVIKSDILKEQENHWTLWTIQPQSKNKSSYQYNNTFGDTHEQEKLIMLLSMFHVSYPARNYKNWLYAVLRWLYQHQADISADKYIQFLEDLSDRYYFGHYGESKDFFDLITQENPNITATSVPENILNSGTKVPNFIFNRLDYLLWNTEQGNYKKFRFTFRSSVEHFYPQTPKNGEPLNNNLDDFGNLCLISSSMNSKFSNNMPLAKKSNFGSDDNASLKLSLMMQQAENWNEETIQKHGEEMIELLNTEAAKA